MAALGGSILSAAVGGLATSLMGSLFDDEPAATPSVAAPAVEAPPVMPIPDDKAAQAARRRSIAKSMGRRGRQSTILTDPVTGGDAGDALGG